jgi:hypothetical protein
MDAGAGNTPRREIRTRAAIQFLLVFKDFSDRIGKEAKPLQLVLASISRKAAANSSGEMFQAGWEGHLR